MKVKEMKKQMKASHSSNQKIPIQMTSLKRIPMRLTLLDSLSLPFSSDHPRRSPVSLIVSKKLTSNSSPPPSPLPLSGSIRLQELQKYDIRKISRTFSSDPSTVCE
jgi:hypothetical protein